MVGYIMNQIEQAFAGGDRKTDERSGPEDMDPADPIEISFWRWTVTITKTGSRSY